MFRVVECVVFIAIHASLRPDFNRKLQVYFESGFQYLKIFRRSFLGELGFFGSVESDTDDYIFKLIEIQQGILLHHPCMTNCLIKKNPAQRSNLM